MERIPVAVIGASGYSGTELLRLLLFHEGTEIVCLTSRQAAGRVLAEEQPRFQGLPQAEALRFVEPTMENLEASGAKVAFLALPHGVAFEFADPLLEAGWRVIDLSDDFRVRDARAYAAFREYAHPAPHLLPKAVYGLPEIHREKIREASLIACPGCYPTSILLPLLPLVKAGCLLTDTICVAAMSGVSGAGRKASVPLLFVECNESVRAYNIPRHRHLAEIEQELTDAAGHEVTISFTPHLVPITAGIAATTYAKAAPGTTPDRVSEVFHEAYAEEPFVRLLGEGKQPDTKHVVGTNYIDIGWVYDPRTDRFVICSAEDNLGKGAASQAIQNFNLMHGLPESSGIQAV
jgi:N-acetyl-gamma-glutamyl-phosphate reductase